MGGVTLNAWVQVLQALLPPGTALSRDPRAVLTKLLAAFAAMLLAAQLRLVDVLAQFDPRRATSLLPDWERLLALPDSCTASTNLTTQDRQILAFAKLTEVGGQSKPYFIDLAARYGEDDVKIDYGFKPFTCNDVCSDMLFSEADRFVWRVAFQHPADNARAMNCEDACDMALQLYTASLAECPLNERKPAHTTLIFSYQALSDKLLARLAKLVLIDTRVLEF